MAQGTAILVAIGRRYYETVLRPRMLLALTTSARWCLLGRQCVAEVPRAAGAGRTSRKESAEIDALYPKAVRNAFDKAYDRCTTQHESRGHAAHHRLGGTLSFLGFDVMVGSNYAPVRVGYRFEDRQDGPPCHELGAVRARIPLDAPVVGNYRFTGPVRGRLAVSAPSPAAIRPPSRGCRKGARPRRASAHPRRGYHGSPATPAHRHLDADPGVRGGGWAMTQACGRGRRASRCRVPTGSSSGYFTRRNGTPGGDRVPDRGLGDPRGALFARNIYQSAEHREVDLTEHTTFELRHTPKP